jgi:hypothetical protein
MRKRVVSKQRQTAMETTKTKKNRLKTTIFPAKNDWKARNVQQRLIEARFCSLPPTKTWTVDPYNWAEGVVTARHDLNINVQDKDHS